jgi:hypothetical protein
MPTPLRIHSLWYPAAFAAALLLVLLVPLTAEPPAFAGAAMRVQLDPESGQLVPVTGLDKATFDRQLSQMLNRSSAGLREIRHADGGVSVDLEGRFQSLSVATIGPEGQLHTGCVASSREWEHFQGTAGTRPSARNR